MRHRLFEELQRLAAETEFLRDVAQQAFDASPVGHKIELRFGPAIDTIRSIDAPIDLSFIDADKTGYDAYYERALRLLRKGGLVAVDNVLWGGAVINSSHDDPDTRAIRSLNAKIAADQRGSCVLLPIGDGLTLALKREN